MSSLRTLCASVLPLSALFGTLSPSVVFALTPVAPRCEYGTAPLNIDVPSPRLSWQLQDTERGAAQSAYQILVASSPDLLAADKGDLWDSGKVLSPLSSNIEYKGAKLSSSQQVFWKARTWDQNDRLSSWTPLASWSMGLLAATDWKASWITAQSTTESFLLRREFTVKPNLKRAIAYVCGLGSYDLHLNGQKQGDALLAPGWTDFDSTALYAAHDITSRLHEGPNAIGLVLGNGMYNVVRKNRFAKFTKSFGPLRAIMHVRLEYADGSVDTLVTDNAWRTAPSATTYNSIYGGEDYDARLEPSGWDLPGFNDSTWKKAVTCVQRTQDVLKGHDWDSEPLRVIEARAPRSINKLPDGRVVYDLGQNASYMLQLRVSGPAGTTVRLTPAEVLNADGSINRNTMGGPHRGSSWWQYTKSTDNEESWTARFYYVGCRYLQAELLPAGAEDLSQAAAVSKSLLPKIEELQGLVVHADARPLGSFDCSNPLLPRIRELVRWAQRSNMVSVLTDCPHREKLGWIEQYHLNGPAIRYEYDVARIYTKAMHDLADAQYDSGLIPNVAPYYPDFQGGFLSAAEWGAAFLLVPWQQYEFTGDTSLMKIHYKAMQRYLAYLESKAKDGILSEGLGDWYDLGPNKPGKAQNTPPPVTASAFLVHDNDLMARIAGLLGKPEDASRYSTRAAELRLRYNKEFYHRDTGSYATGSQCANAMALALDLVEPSEKPRVLAALIADLEKNSFSTTAGDIGFRYVLLALADNGRSDLIYRMINQDDKPGYGYMLKKGETSLTESWDANLGSSHNHFMLGQITEWFYRDLIGIRPDDTKPGFRHLLLRPTPVGDLTWAEGSYESLHGPVSLRWDKAADALRVRLSIPANTTARLELPCSGTAPVLTESGKPWPLTSQPKDARLPLELASGTYDFLLKTSP